MVYLFLLFSTTQKGNRRFVKKRFLGYYKRDIHRQNYVFMSIS